VNTLPALSLTIALPISSPVEPIVIFQAREASWAFTEKMENKEKKIDE
jgi:hypothetical protein